MNPTYIQVGNFKVSLFFLLGHQGDCRNLQSVSQPPRVPDAPIPFLSCPGFPGDAQKGPCCSQDKSIAGGAPFHPAPWLQRAQSRMADPCRKEGTETSPATPPPELQALGLCPESHRCSQENSSLMLWLSFLQQWIQTLSTRPD